MILSNLAPAALADFRVLLKIGPPVASDALVCVSGLIAHGSRVRSSVGLLGGVLGWIEGLGCPDSF